MEKAALLAELKAMADGVPDLNNYQSTSRIHLEWLGRLHALILQWDKYEASGLRLNVNYLAIPVMRQVAVSEILNLLHRAIADLEIQIPSLPTGAFGPGAVYDFMKNLREILMSASHSLFIIDPYIDDEVFDGYLSVIPTTISVRILADRYAPSVKSGLNKFLMQKKMAVEARQSNRIHDRVVFVDGRSCWVIGQSLKDAAKSKPTYIAPLALDATQLKLADYEQIWQSATPI